MELTGDDRALILGALIWMVEKLRSEQGDRARELWAEKGKETFEADRQFMHHSDVGRKIQEH